MLDNNLTGWGPKASLKMVQERAVLLRKLREFFDARNIMEVDTPLLYHTTTTEPTIDSFTVNVAGKIQYLQTSPEFAMKRLLAAGSGSIYQMCKAFRVEESGRYHNPEFSILEWYHLGFTHHDLMEEMDAFLQYVMGTTPATTISYQQLFEKHFNINPHTSTVDALEKIAVQHKIHYVNTADKDTWLNLLLSHLIEPTLGDDAPCFVYDYPTSQAALAKINHGVAERFEVYYKGIELANGFHELTDAKAQRKRFETECGIRHQAGQNVPPIDDYLLAALEAGLPHCSGVALGFDRLVMLATQSKSLGDIMTFPQPY